jgi:hypothetical protein
MEGEKDAEGAALPDERCRLSKIQRHIEQAGAAGLPSHPSAVASGAVEKIITQAHHNGEPGLLFLDAANRSTCCIDRHSTNLWGAVLGHETAVWVR